MFIKFKFSFISTSSSLLSPGANIWVFVGLHNVLHKFPGNSWANWEHLLSLSPVWHSIWGGPLNEGRIHTPVHDWTEKTPTLITSRHKTPLTNSKQGARSLLWLTGHAHTHLQKVLILSGWEEEITCCCVCNLLVPTSGHDAKRRWNQTDTEVNVEKQASQFQVASYLLGRLSRSAEEPLCVKMKEEVTNTHTTLFKWPSRVLHSTFNWNPKKRNHYTAPSKVNFSQRWASQSHGEVRSPGPRPPEIGTDNLLLQLKQWSYTHAHTDDLTRQNPRSEWALLMKPAVNKLKKLNVCWETDEI